MTTEPQSRDRGLEPLLVEFYRAEMPVELRAAEFDAPEFDVPEVGHRDSTRDLRVEPVHSVARIDARPAPAIAGRAGGRAVISVAAVCLLAALIGIPGADPASTPENDGTAASSDSGDPNVPGPERLEPAFTLTTDDVFVERVDGRIETFGAERIETSGGPVELRTVRETTNVSVFDPETGNGVDVTSGVLDIEIVPIEEPEPSVGDELPDPRDDAPLPPEFGSP